jgi:hypothetical protein
MPALQEILGYFLNWKSLSNFIWADESTSLTNLFLDKVVFAQAYAHIKFLQQPPIANWHYSIF